MRKRIIIATCALLLVGAFVGLYLYIVIGSPFAHKVWFHSIYTGTKIELKVDGYYFDRGMVGEGKACYASKKSEEDIVKEISDNGAHFFNVAGYRFFTLDGTEGVYNLRISQIEEKENSNCKHRVIIDDMSCTLSEGESRNVRIPFPGFVIGNGELKKLYLFRDYEVDTQALLEVADGLNIWEMTQESENGYNLLYEDKIVSVIVQEGSLRIESMILPEY